MVVSFLGHREIFQIESMREELFSIVQNLITHEGATRFLFGSRSKFDELCLAVVSELKKSNPHIQRIYVRAEYPCIGDSYKKKLMERYDDTYFPEKIRNAGSAIYVERNYEMIDKSESVFFIMIRIISHIGVGEAKRIC